MKHPKVVISLVLFVSIGIGGFIYIKEGIKKGVQAYLYAYPMVMMKTTRQASVGKTYNEINHSRTFPDHTFRRVVRPNVDTLYSTIWFDLAKEPVVVELPSSQGRYYLMPILDAWTNVIASIGSRTTGNNEQTIIVIGPEWQGDVPQGMTVVKSSTNTAWAIGRSDTKAANADGSPSEDMLSAYSFQSAMSATPLSRWQKGERDKQTAIKAFLGTERQPVKTVASMNAETFYSHFYSFLKTNPSPQRDTPFIQTIMASVGLDRMHSSDGQEWSFAELGFLNKFFLTQGVKRIPDIMQMISQRRQRDATGWSNMPSAGIPLGRYETNYGLRAFIAHVGLGANEAIDAIYPNADRDLNGLTLNGDKRYRLHFTTEQLPPVRGFWSLTLYNKDAFLSDNQINRYALGGRDELVYNTDGSLDIYVQPTAPSNPEHYSNWLPSPAGDAFALTMRLYWPEDRVLSGNWTMPAIEPY